MRPIDPIDPKDLFIGQGEPQTAQDLVNRLLELQELANDLQLKVVSAMLASAIGMIPVTRH